MAKNPNFPEAGNLPTGYAHRRSSDSFTGIDEDEMAAEEPSAAVPEEIPPLEGDEDKSRMEEID